MRFTCKKCEGFLSRLYYLKYLGYKNKTGYPVKQTGTSWYWCQKCDSIQKIVVKIKSER